MKCFCAWIMGFLAVAAGQTVPNEPATASVRGVVKESSTHAPLDGARVYAAAAKGEESDTTGPQGQFAISNLQAGRNWISVYDKRRAASGGAYVLLRPGQDLAGVEIFIKAGGSIAGTVVDEDRKPVSGAAVVVLESAFEFGRAAYRPVLTAQTDGNGEYRLAPVPSGRRVLILAKKAIQPAKHETLPADREKRPRLLVPTFYPGSKEIEGGQPVVLGPSEDRPHTDIEMRSSPSYCIAGTVRISGDAVQLLTISERFPLEFQSSMTPVKVPVSHGKFGACGFHPGDYKLNAVGNEKSDVPVSGIRRLQMDAFAQVTVNSQDLDDVQLVPSLAVTVPGELLWDPPPPAQAAEQRIRIAFAKFWTNRHADEEESSGLSMTGMSYGDRFPVPGPFAMEGLPVDDYKLQVSGLPEGCYVKEATYAGVDVTHQPVRLTDTAGGRLRVVLACDGGSLTARVTDRDGNPVPHVTLFVVPQSAGSAAELQDLLQQAEVENGWSGSVRPVPGYGRRPGPRRNRRTGAQVVAGAGER